MKPHRKVKSSIGVQNPAALQKQPKDSSVSSSDSGPLVQIEGNLTSAGYRDILENRMLPFTRERLAPGWTFQQDGAAVTLASSGWDHFDGFLEASLAFTGWFRLNNVPLLRTPSLSSDLNPIENLWHFVKLIIVGRHT
uniref:DDE_3 domain-containing protein n=1 Tax=Globodera pallida TaxID=36090 RepID=A0A183C6V7_GLOPA